MEKISFDVENLEIVPEDNDSQFSVAKVQAFSSGINLHNMNCSREVLEKTAPTIYNKPLIYNYDSRFDDFGTHTTPEKSLIAGFAVPNSAFFKELDDGRMSFDILIRIWKRYVPDVMRLLHKNSKKKISVEMDLIEAEENSDGTIEMKNFSYAAICILGDSVQEASPGANLEVLCFSKEKNEYEIIKKEFSKYEDVDFQIPKKVKNNIEKGLSLQKEKGGGTSVSLALARFISRNEKINPNKLRHMAKIHKSRKFLDVKENNVEFFLYGGKEGKEWSEKLCLELEEIDKKHTSYFSESEESLKKEEFNMEDEKEPVEKVEEMAVETPEEEKKEDPKEEKDETPEEEKKEEMSLNANLDVSALLAMLGKETENYEEIVAEFAKPEEEKNFSKVVSALYSKMCKMSEQYQEMCNKFAQKEEETKAYMSENEELKKFKADVEEKQFMFEVESTMAELQKSVEMPKEEMSALREEAKQFSLSNIDAFKNLAKARAFNFAVKAKSDVPEIKRYGLPWGSKEDKKKSLWD